MKINKYKNKIINKKIQETKLHASPPFLARSFAAHIGDHFRFGIICGPIWGSFPVWGSFAVGDHLVRCTVLLSRISGRKLQMRTESQTGLQCWEEEFLANLQN